MGSLAKPIRKRDPKYLAWIRQQPCLVTRLRHISPNSLATIEAHHVREEGHGGVGTKPDDSRAVPLQSWLHRLYHDIGRNEFEERFTIELEAEIKRLNAMYSRTERVKRERPPTLKSRKDVLIQAKEKQLKKHVQAAKKLKAELEQMRVIITWCKID